MVRLRDKDIENKSRSIRVKQKLREEWEMQFHDEIDRDEWKGRDRNRVALKNKSVFDCHNFS